jgi:SAM-dependent methyltransferase
MALKRSQEASRSRDDFTQCRRLTLLVNLTGKRSVKEKKVQNVFRRLLFHYWYFGQPPWDTGVSPPELLEFIQTHKAGRAIDIGCGTGTNVVTLARAGWRVIGVDFAPRAISLAKRKLNAENVRAELRVADATKLDGINGPFDLAFDLGCFHSLPSTMQPKYLDQLERILAPDGWILPPVRIPKTRLGSFRGRA